MTDDKVLNTTDLYLIKQALKDFGSQVFIIERSPITVQITGPLDSSSSLTVSSRRVLLHTEVDYQVDILMKTNSYDDANDTITDSNITANSISDYLSDETNGTVNSVTNYSISTITEDEGENILSGNDSSITNLDANSNNNDDGLEWWIILLIVLICICCLLCIICCMYLRNKNKRDHETFSKHNDRIEQGLNDETLEMVQIDDSDDGLVDTGVALPGDTGTNDGEGGDKVTGGGAAGARETTNKNAGEGEELEIELVEDTKKKGTDVPELAPVVSSVKPEPDQSEELLLTSKGSSNKKSRAKRAKDSLFNIVVETKELIMPLKSYVDKMETTNGNNETGDHHIVGTRDVLTDVKVTSAAGGIGNAKGKGNDASSVVVKYDDIEFGEELGNGQFGRVYEAVLNDKTVAVKRLSNDIYKDDERIDNDKELYSEIVLACRLPSHPNIVRVLGFVSNPLCIVMDYMTGGTAKDYCYVDENENESENRNKNKTVGASQVLKDDVKNAFDNEDDAGAHENDYKRKVSIDEIIILLSKAANGIKLLHKYGLVHGNISATNILGN